MTIREPGSQRNGPGGYTWDLVGDHPRMQALRELVERAAPLSPPVLVVGETGTGKELVARALHGAGGWAGPLVPINIAALPEALIESELFGSLRGGFTGATDRPGVVEQAAGGTLFLDEAGDIPPAAQVKLLRAIESGQSRRVGGNRLLSSAFRLVTSVQADPESLVSMGLWRPDFYYRVGSLVLRIPALRERISDVPALVNHYLGLLGRDPVSADLLDGWYAHPWPGNVRELRGAVERAVFLANGRDLVSEYLNGALLGATGPNDTDGSLKNAERAHIAKVLADCDFRVDIAARRLGVSRAQLYRKLRALELPSKPERSRTPRLLAAPDTVG